MAKTPTMVDLVGTPFEYGARGPHAYDCYGLLMECWRRKHGVALPEFKSPSDQAVQAAVGAVQLQLWEQVPEQPGVMVAIRIGRMVSHCGFTLPGGLFIHAWEKSGGVTIQPLDTWRQRITGFYRYVG